MNMDSYPIMMLDPWSMFYLAAALIVTISIVLLIRHQQNSHRVNLQELARRNQALSRRTGDATVGGGTRARQRGQRRVIQRTNETSSGSSASDESESEKSGDETKKKKIGTKKARKLEEKEERRKQREADEIWRKKKAEEDAKKDAERREKEAREEHEIERQKDEEKRLQELKEQAEYEEYLKLKAEMSIEEEGMDALSEENQKQQLQEFIGYIKEKEIVLLEDLAGKFAMRIDDVVNRLEALLKERQLTGVIDDRGKFIYISMEKLERISKVIKQHGRISISKLAEECNHIVSS